MEGLRGTACGVWAECVAAVEVHEGTLPPTTGCRLFSLPGGRSSPGTRGRPTSPGAGRARRRAEASAGAPKRVLLHAWLATLLLLLCRMACGATWEDRGRSRCGSGRRDPARLRRLRPRCHGRGSRQGDSQTSQSPDWRGGARRGSPRWRQGRKRASRVPHRVSLAPLLLLHRLVARGTPREGGPRQELLRMRAAEPRETPHRRADGAVLHLRQDSEQRGHCEGPRVAPAHPTPRADRVRGATR